MPLGLKSVESRAGPSRSLLLLLSCHRLHLLPTLAPWPHPHHLLAGSGTNPSFLSVTTPRMERYGPISRSSIPHPRSFPGRPPNPLLTSPRRHPLEPFFLLPTHPFFHPSIYPALSLLYPCPTSHERSIPSYPTPSRVRTVGTLAPDVCLQQCWRGYFCLVGRARAGGAEVGWSKVSERVGMGKGRKEGKLV